MTGQEFSTKLAADLDAYLAEIRSPGVPPSHRSIDRIIRTFSGRRAQIDATLTMFDGKPGEIRLTECMIGAEKSWSHRWMHADEIWWDEKKREWQRTPAPTLDDRVGKYLRDIAHVGRHHGFSLGADDEGGLVVVPYDPGDATIADAGISEELDAREQAGIP